MMERRPEHRRGLTLVELIVATGLASMLVVALVTLVETALGVWSRTETRRDLLEHSTAILELVADDLISLEGGTRGDLLADWAAFDTDGDGIDGIYMPRLRIVRRVSAAELSRRGLLPSPADPEFRTSERTVAPGSAGALLEVTWLLLPAQVGSLRRGERLVPTEDTESVFGDEFFDAAGSAPQGATSQVSEAVLWFAPVFASQTSELEAGWTIGEGLFDCARAWDARTSGRLDEELSSLNAPPAGCPESKRLPVFPRRIRIELEIERAKDLKQRTTLSVGVDRKQTAFQLRDARFAPRAGDFVRLDEEWVEVRRVDGARLTVVRGVRGTRNADHEPGARIHFGKRTVRELRVPAYREDWNL